VWADVTVSAYLGHIGPVVTLIFSKHFCTRAWSLITTAREAHHMLNWHAKSPCHVRHRYRAQGSQWTVWTKFRETRPGQAIEYSYPGMRTCTCLCGAHCAWPWPRCTPDVSCPWPRV